MNAKAPSGHRIVHYPMGDFWMVWQYDETGYRTDWIEYRSRPAAEASISA